jgi:phosphoribosylcarboxyaminoimidazole (NCAIR) mutase
MKRIQIILGSSSDLPQCLEGLRHLQWRMSIGDVYIRGVRINSIHRNTLAALWYITWMWILNWFGRVHILIIGAGMANQLTGTSEAFLRYFLRSDKLTVIGVAFAGKTEEATLAAELSITQVPGSQVVFHGFVGPDGFLEACKYAINVPLPKIKLPAKKPTANFTFERAIQLAEEKK